MDLDVLLRRAKLSRYATQLRSAQSAGAALDQLSGADLDKLGIPARDQTLLLRALQAYDQAKETFRGRVASADLAGVNIAAQRRHLTVMICDLVGSTALSAQLDPEDMHELIDAYRRCCTRHIEAAGGFIAKYMGDGILVYFGYPKAHEHDAGRAIHAALNIAKSVPYLSTPSGVPLGVRIGVATGVVVVGDDNDELDAVVGDAPNIAARLQTQGAPNSVIVSESTRKLAAGVFEFRALGSVKLKGLPQPEPLWQALDVADAPDRFWARRDAIIAPMLGRERELKHLLSRWGQVRKSNQAHMIGIAGDAGIGKSRLLYEFRKGLVSGSHLWLEGGGAEVFENTPFFTFARMIRRSLATLSPASKSRLSPGRFTRALERSLHAVGMDIDHTMPLIADLIGVPTPDHCPPLALNGEQRRRALMTAMLEWLTRSAQRQPTIVATEDLHWADASTRELLWRLYEANPPVLFLYTLRGDAAPPWPLNARHERITLFPLSAAATRSLVSETSSQPITATLRERIVDRAGGVPLFAEELTRLMSSDGSDADARPIPETISDLLEARLDQLGSAKRVALVAAVIGDAFPFAVLHKVVGGRSNSLRKSLAHLSQSGVLKQRGADAEPVYAFKHALLQDAAYAALLRRQRRALHERVATVLQHDFPEIATAQPELMARHWQGAGQSELAAGAWQASAHAARARHAFKEAQSAYRQSLEALALAPASQSRDELELRLQIGLATTLQITDGYAAPATIAAARRARALAEPGGDISERLVQAGADWAARSSKGAYIEAADLADHVLELAASSGDAVHLAQAHMIQMTSRYRLGQLIEAEDYFSSGEAYFEHPKFSSQPGAAAQTYGNAARIAWLLGDSAQSARRTACANAHATRNANPYDMAFAHYMGAIMALLGDQTADAKHLGETSMALADQHGYSQFAAISRIVVGRAMAHSARDGQAVALIRQGIAAMARTRSRVALTMYMTWLAEAQHLAGDAEAAARTLCEALDINPQELFYRPETLRQRGESYLHLGLRDEAKIDFGEAIRASKRMGAKQLYLRALSAQAKLASG